MTHAVNIRPLRAEERAWVASSWMTGLHQHLRVKRLPHRLVALIDGVLDAGVIRVADVEGEAMGWVAADHGTLWWIYVRHPARRNFSDHGGGIGKALLMPASPVLRAFVVTAAGRALAHAVLGRVPRQDPWAPLPATEVRP